MRNFTPLLFLLITASVFSQSPQKMSYQAVIRDASNTLVSNQSVGMQISILQTTTTETAVYTETHTVTANINGLISLEIGTGSTSDNFSTIDWSAGPYFIKTETDPTGGNSYTIIGTSQLMSVPFALYAKTSENGITSDQADAIVANTAKTGITTQQATDITSNNAKTGITTVQSDAIEVNTAKTSMVLGITAETALVGNTVTITTVQSEAIIANTAKVSYIQPTYELNTFYAALGGYVIDINSDGKHGVVLAMKDQGYDNWYNANNLLNNPDNHDTEGAQFRDWRLPSKRELNLMYLSYLNGNPTNLAGATYWSSSEFKFDYAWLHYFFSGQQDDVNKVNPYNIRVVRSF